VTIAYRLTIVAFPIRAIGWLLSEFPRSVAGFGRVSRVLEATGEQEYGDRSLPAATDGARLELRDVGYGYVPDRRVLSGLSFAIRPGRTTALVGATASGKSTLTALVLRLVDPDVGAVLV